MDPFPPISELRLGAWGDIKSAKSTLALSFPKPLVHFDLDLSVIRAIHRFSQYSIEVVPLFMPLSIWLQARTIAQGQPLPDIIIIPYQVPMKWPGHKISGMMEMFDAFADDMFTALTTEKIRSLSVDTGTMVWKIATAAHLQRVQIDKPERQNLIQIEYTRPNTQLRGLYGGATTYHKNLCITHHVGGVYQDVLTPKGVESQRTGDTWDGFGAMGQMVDIVGRTYITRDAQGFHPTLRIDTCGYTLAMEGLEMVEPTFDSLLSKINELRSQGL